MRRKSISAEDLRNVLKKMINGALTDSEQVEKLHQIICYQWYNNEFRNTKNTRNNDIEPTQCEFESSMEIIMPYKIQEKKDSAKDSKSYVELCENQTEEDSSYILENINLKDSENIQHFKEPIVESEESVLQKRRCSSKKLSFEEWKEKKTAMYKEMLKNYKLEMQQMQNTIKTENERKKRAQAEQEYIKVAQLEQERLYNKYVKRLKQAQMENQETEMNARRIMNENAFNAWKKRKDAELREQRKAMLAFYGYENNIERSRKESAPLMADATLKFTSWLNQLNWVLYEKYVREHRHRVRSYYCQPTYYGAA